MALTMTVMARRCLMSKTLMEMATSLVRSHPMVGLRASASSLMEIVIPMMLRFIRGRMILIPALMMNCDGVEGSGQTCVAVNATSSPGETVFLICEDEHNRADALSQCYSHNYDALASVQSASENQLLEQYVQTNSWIGLEQVWNNYTWSDGSPVVYNNIQSPSF